MKIRVELQGYLDQFSPTGNDRFDYDAPEGATVEDVMNRLGVPTDIATVIVVNDDAAEASQPLAEGARLTFIPPLGGG